jgi:hypothetical protein
MAVRIQFRRGTAAEWTAANPVLAAGELGIELDTNKYKIGDGATVWNSLDYQSLPGDAIGQSITDAKGDLIVATAANTVGRLAVGANNTALIADSATSTGVKWAEVGTVYANDANFVIGGSVFS